VLGPSRPSLARELQQLGFSARARGVVVLIGDLVVTAVWKTLADLTREPVVVAARLPQAA
jgi:hypothetical protein